MNEEKAIAKAPKLYQQLTMHRAKKVANELIKFVKDNQLTVGIAGKDYLYTEAWQFVGETQMGLTQVVVSCDRIPTEDPKEVKYKSVVEIINQSGTVISRGFAFCSNLEKKKKGFEEYAIASMAQTRAIGKAYRNILAWIVRMAGYEATPVEEIDKDSMEEDLAKAKRNVVRKFHDADIKDSEKMVEIIEKAIGKPVIETIEEARAVVDELEKENETTENS